MDDCDVDDVIFDVSHKGRRICRRDEDIYGSDVCAAADRMVVLRLDPCVMQERERGVNMVVDVRPCCEERSTQEYSFVLSCPLLIWTITTIG